MCIANVLGMKVVTNMHAKCLVKCTVCTSVVAYCVEKCQLTISVQEWNVVYHCTSLSVGVRSCVTAEHALCMPALWPTCTLYTHSVSLPSPSLLSPSLPRSPSVHHPTFVFKLCFYFRCIVLCRQTRGVVFVSILSTPYP